MRLHLRKKEKRRSLKKKISQPSTYCLDVCREALNSVKKAKTFTSHDLNLKTQFTLLGSL